MIRAAAALLAVSVMAAAAAAAAASAEPYHIQTNSPVHVAGTGSESVLVYGEAPGAQRVDVTIGNHTHAGVVRDGAFHMVVPAPPPGTYRVHGVWYHTAVEPSAGGMVETETAGHLVGGVLTVLGHGYDDEPASTVVVRPGAHREGCAACVDHSADAVEAGGYVLVSNADSEGHRFVTDSIWAVHSTGHLDPGESARLPFNREGDAQYGCAYHPWLGFAVEAAGMYEPVEPVESGGALALEAPAFAGDSVRVGISHTGAADAAHIVFIQGGRVLEAGMVRLAGGYGVYAADAREWRVGEVTVSVSAGADHAADTISVGPPPGAAERAGRITGHDGADGILINGGLARPAGLMPLDAAAGATRQVCMLGQEALFRGDPGLAPHGSHYSEGTVWCDGVNLGVYLLEGGLAMADPVQCGAAQAGWLVPYCMAGSADAAVSAGAEPAATVSDDLPEGAAWPEDAVERAEGAGQAEDAEQGGKPPILVPEDQPAVPGDVAEPGPDGACGHHADGACPCPEGWVRNGEWCDPDWDDMADSAMDAAGGAGGAGEAAEDAGGAAGGALGGVREGATDALRDFFEWAADGMAAVGDFIVDFSRGLVGGWGT